MQIHPPPREVIAELEEAIAAAIPDAEIDVSGAAGHFEIKVVSPVFDGKNRLARQRLVYGAIAHLMKGDEAPVHAVDRLECQVP